MRLKKAEQSQFIYFPIRTPSVSVCVCVAFFSQNLYDCTHCNLNEFDLIMYWTLLLQPKLMSSSHQSWVLVVWAIRKFLVWKNHPPCFHHSKTMCEMCLQGKCVCWCVCMCTVSESENWMPRLMFLSFQRIITCDWRGWWLGGESKIGG